MENLTLLTPGFIAGMVVGALITSISLRIADKRRRELNDAMNARERILAGIKETHEKEILREIFRAKDALNSDLNKSLRLLQASTEKLLKGIKEADAMKTGTIEIEDSDFRRN